MERVMGIFDMINSFLNPDQPYQAAEDQIQKGWQQAQGYEQPFMQQGLDQYGNLMTAENALLNPAALENQWASQYQTSPYAQQLLAQNKSSGLDAASSMGLMGSSGALNNIQTGAGNIVNQDRQQFLNDLMQKYMTGISVGQNIYGTGANAASNLAGGAMQTGENMAGLAYGKAAAPGDFFGKLLGTGGDLALNYFSGGMPGLVNASNNMFGYNANNNSTAGSYTG
jgi:hypothetical protein